MNVLITGSSGFIGSNLSVALACRADVKLYKYDTGSPAEILDKALAAADLVFHLAGVNRPRNPEEFKTGNAGFTEEIRNKLVALGRAPKIVLTSSIQAELDNPYGRSKLAAEEEIRRYADATRAPGVVYRLKNVFGKWCRPNYNSVTATFCHTIAHGLPVMISDPAKTVDLTYIDDVVSAFIGELEGDRMQPGYRLAGPLASRQITLGALAGLVQSFRDHRSTLLLPDFSDPFARALYATYLSYLEPADRAYPLEKKTDERGSLAEFIKAKPSGQLFISRTKPGTTRGNHYHHTKTEKFLVVEGEAVVRIRDIRNGASTEYKALGTDYKVIDIPPGCTHSIENTGRNELVTLFWSSEIFDRARPDTTFLKVRE